MWNTCSGGGADFFPDLSDLANGYAKIRIISNTDQVGSNIVEKTVNAGYAYQMGPDTLSGTGFSAAQCLLYIDPKRLPYLNTYPNKYVRLSRYGTQITMIGFKNGKPYLIDIRDDNASVFKSFNLASFDVIMIGCMVQSNGNSWGKIEWFYSS